jgi:hypothetical protein
LKQIKRVSADVLRDQTESAEIVIKNLCKKSCIIVIKPKSSALSEEKGSYTRLTLLYGARRLRDFNECFTSANECNAPTNNAKQAKSKSRPKSANQKYDTTF